MTDGLSACRLSGLLQEVAEGLQAAGSYLGAARRISSDVESEPASTAHLIDKAAGEMLRAQTAFHRLRDHLLRDRLCGDDATNALVQTGANLAVVSCETSEKLPAD